jgi:hypothetical protein
MSEIPPPGLLSAALEGRFASVVYIMKGRRSPFSRLGVLELEARQLSLQDRKGALLFAVPAASVQARPARRSLPRYTGQPSRSTRQIDGGSW